MPLPVRVKITDVKGKEYEVQLPVEIWQRGDSYTFPVELNAAPREIVADPYAALPDVNRSNNEWKN
jgi:hypothetical protein